VSHNEHEIQKPPLRLGVLISGSGTNLQALIDAIENQQLPGVEIALVVSNNPDAHGLQRALKHKIPAIYLPWRKANVGYREPGQHTSRALSEAKRSAYQYFVASADLSAPGGCSAIGMPESEARLTALLQLFQADLIVLAGWMRIFSAAFLEHFPQRVINIHPALLPDAGTGSTYTTSNGTQIPVFRGLHAVKQALDAGVKITGSCVHYVTPEVDAGPGICREEVAIEEGDTEETLHERLKLVEHRLIVEAVRKLR
jgi:phosphoribosylglycinamide formyltransferase 1